MLLFAVAEIKTSLHWGRRQRHHFTRLV